MVAVLTAALMTAAEISNLCSALAVLLCFICMAVFIIRVQGGDVFGTSVVHVAQPPITRVAYHKVPVPFSLELHKPRETSFSEVLVRVRSQVSYELHGWWGVSAAHLHTLLSLPWASFLPSLLSQSSLGAQVLSPTLRKEVRDGWGENTERLGLAGGSSGLQLGSVPRSCYPLVLCLARCPHPVHPAPHEVGAVVSVIHIRDSQCEVPTCVLHQYLKQYSGQLTQLQALYTQGGGSSEVEGSKVEEATEAKETEEVEGEEEVPLEEACVVCQTARTTRALLPCRHVCVCEDCCGRLDHCPLCRARILAYFLVGREEVGPGMELGEIGAGQWPGEMREGQEEERVVEQVEGTEEVPATVRRRLNAHRHIVPVQQHL